MCDERKDNLSTSINQLINIKIYGDIIKGLIGLYEKRTVKYSKSTNIMDDPFVQMFNWKQTNITDNIMKLYIKNPNHNIFSYILTIEENIDNDIECTLYYECSNVSKHIGVFAKNDKDSFYRFCGNFLYETLPKYLKINFKKH